MLFVHHPRPIYGILSKAKQLSNNKIKSSVVRLKMVESEKVRYSKLFVYCHLQITVIISLSN